MTYKLEILPIAKKEIENILFYISYNLKNISAARDLSRQIFECMNTILLFPFGASIYKTKRKLEKEYRFVKVKNYLIFYTINEDIKVITIARVLYRKMNISNIID